MKFKGRYVERTRLIAFEEPHITEDGHYYIAGGYDPIDGYQGNIYWLKDEFESGNFAAWTAYWINKKDGTDTGLFGSPDYLIYSKWKGKDRELRNWHRRMKYKNNKKKF